MPYGIPSQNMQDNGNGCRNDYFTGISKSKAYNGECFAEDREQVTSFPVSLAIAAIWSEEDYGRFGASLAKEFRIKGANVLLGPAVNVHRVPRCGRNAEYLSGESGYLGARLVKPYVRGLQSNKVLSSVKHFINNNQENCRSSSNSIVDDRTRWEVYYPPFEAAVQADVAAQMCGYNLVNGEYNCQSRQVMQVDLKEKMGFRGWVQSDWWALKDYDAAINAGIDQEMPHGDYFQDYRLNGLADWQRDRMVRPQLDLMLSHGLFVRDNNTCSFGGGCDRQYYEV